MELERQRREGRRESAKLTHDDFSKVGTDPEADKQAALRVQAVIKGMQTRSEVSACSRDGKILASSRVQGLLSRRQARMDVLKLHKVREEEEATEALEAEKEVLRTKVREDRVKGEQVKEEAEVLHFNLFPESDLPEVLSDLSPN